MLSSVSKNDKHFTSDGIASAAIDFRDDILSPVLELKSWTEASGPPAAMRFGAISKPRGIGSLLYSEKCRYASDCWCACDLGRWRKS